ncbi:hypothetical protein BKA59DRAFT_232384 [Fusarium tricinctum]|uniref:Uncharacterized protein n=1 Tax=Fusarium tricinctum TaxID=61284 RepID=A0A8K0RV72_9HYPO|nr:hypothetical protein BKA59DRAFT_232384 [Fusarium tricinctum]
MSIRGSPTSQRDGVDQMHDIASTRLDSLDPSGLAKGYEQREEKATPSRALRVAQSMCLHGVLLELVWSAKKLGSPSGPSSKRRLVRRENRPRSITCTRGFVLDNRQPLNTSSCICLGCRPYFVLALGGCIFVLFYFDRKWGPETLRSVPILC